MTTEVQRFSRAPSGQSHPPRKLRNYLLEPKFQLKYTSMVVGVTLIVGAVLGYHAYKYSTGQTELLNIERMDSRGANIDERFIADLERYAHEADRKVLLAIIGGVGALALALGFTGIIVTHRLVGPAYRMTQLLDQVRHGQLKLAGKLRKHDELQNVFEAFQRMVTSLRTARELDVQQLDQALEAAQQAQAPEAVLSSLREVRNRIQRTLD